MTCTLCHRLPFPLPRLPQPSVPLPRPTSDKTDGSHSSYGFSFSKRKCSSSSLKPRDPFLETQRPQHFRRGLRRRHNFVACTAVLSNGLSACRDVGLIVTAETSRK